MAQPKLLISCKAAVFRAALALACLLPPVAQARVLRCMDNTGNVQFTNLGCPSAPSGNVIDVRSNAVDTSGMRRRNQAELVALQDRRQAERTVPMYQSETRVSE